MCVYIHVQGLEQWRVYRRRSSVGCRHGRGLFQQNGHTSVHWSELGGQEAGLVAKADLLNPPPPPPPPTHTHTHMHTCTHNHTLTHIIHIHSLTHTHSHALTRTHPLPCPLPDRGDHLLTIPGEEWVAAALVFEEETSPVGRKVHPRLNKSVSDHI